MEESNVTENELVIKTSKYAPYTEPTEVKIPVPKYAPYDDPTEVVIPAAKYAPYTKPVIVNLDLYYNAMKDKSYVDKSQNVDEELLGIENEVNDLISACGELKGETSAELSSASEYLKRNAKKIRQISEDTLIPKSESLEKLNNLLERREILKQEVSDVEKIKVEQECFDLINQIKNNNSK